VDNILAEHVFEHMTFEDGFKAASNCYRALKPFGRLRIAVPDGFHPDPAYINWVKPGGIWNPHDHLVLYNYKTLSKLLMRAGFRVLLLEWHDERGQLHVRQWSDANGMVWRSVKHWYAGFLTLVVGARYTSLIVDAVKVEGK
jgi:predicted SAM-dependent methyltransferase